MFLAAGMQRFDHQQMWASGRQIKEISFWRKAEALVKAFHVGSTVAPDFGRQGLCAGIVNKRLNDFAACAGSTHVFPHGHTANAPVVWLCRMFARLRQDGANTDQLPVQEGTDMQGTRRCIIRKDACVERLMRSEDTMAQIVGFCSADGVKLDS